MKNLWQRYTLGAGCCDIFNAHHYLEKKILPVLKQFREHTGGYPSSLDDMGQWLTILDEIIWAFEYREDFNEPYDFEKERRDGNRQQFGFELFGMYFNSLWI